MFEKFYGIYIAIFVICIDLFFVGFLDVIITELIKNNFYICLIVFIILLPMFCYLIYYNYYLFKYYLNYVKRITFSNGEMIVLTAKKIYKIPIEKVIYVKKTKVFLFSITILYNDGVKNRKLIAQTYKNNPFCIERFDIEEFKSNLPYTKFI